MKQKDIALIVVIVIVSGMISFFVARSLFATASSRQVKAEHVEAITTDFAQPSSRYFNDKSINPTQLIQIGNSTNVTPYGGR